MSVITISTNNYKMTKEARIDGALYEVRRLGPGDQLDISMISNKLLKASREAMNIKGEVVASRGAKDIDQAEQLESISATLDNIAKLQQELENCYVKLFVPKDDKADAVALVHSIGADGVYKVLAQIFADDVKE